MHASTRYRKVWKNAGSLLFILPALLFYLSFVLIPVLQNVVFSLFEWQGPSGHFVGIANYVRLFQDPIFYNALIHNVIWVSLTLLFPLGIGLVLAATLVKVRHRTSIAAIYFVPRTVPFVVSGAIWGLMYNYEIGLVNFLLDEIGLSSLKRVWLADPSITLYALNFLGAWTFFGFCSLILLNALQNVDPCLYEAAEIDGASSFHQFRYITIPMLKNTIIFLIVYSTIAAMTFFDLVHITTQGGPGYATDVVSLYIYRLVVREGKIAYPATISVMLSIIILGFTLVVIRLRRED